MGIVKTVENKTIFVFFCVKTELNNIYLKIEEINKIQMIVSFVNEKIKVDKYKLV